MTFMNVIDVESGPTEKVTFGHSDTQMAECNSGGLEQIALICGYCMMVSVLCKDRFQVCSGWVALDARVGCSVFRVLINQIVWS